MLVIEKLNQSGNFQAEFLDSSIDFKYSKFKDEISFDDLEKFFKENKWVLNFQKIINQKVAIENKLNLNSFHFQLPILSIKSPFDDNQFMSNQRLLNIFSMKKNGVTLDTIKDVKLAQKETPQDKKIQIQNDKKQNKADDINKLSDKEIKQIIENDLKKEGEIIDIKVDQKIEKVNNEKQQEDKLQGEKQNEQIQVEENNINKIVSNASIYQDVKIETPIPIKNIPEEIKEQQSQEKSKETVQDDVQSQNKDQLKDNNQEDKQQQRDSQNNINKKNQDKEDIIKQDKQNDEKVIQNIEQKKEMIIQVIGEDVVIEKESLKNQNQEQQKDQGLEKVQEQILKEDDKTKEEEQIKTNNHIQDKVEEQHLQVVDVVIQKKENNETIKQSLENQQNKEQTQLKDLSKDEQQDLDLLELLLLKYKLDIDILNLYQLFSQSKDCDDKIVKLFQTQDMSLEKSKENCLIILQEYNNLKKPNNQTQNQSQGQQQQTETKTESQEPLKNQTMQDANQQQLKENEQQTSQNNEKDQTTSITDINDNQNKQEILSEKIDQDFDNKFKDIFSDSSDVKNSNLQDTINQSDANEASK